MPPFDNPEQSRSEKVMGFNNLVPPVTVRPRPVMVIPLATVDVAEVPVRLRYAAARAPVKVEVEFDPVTLRNPWSVEVPAAVPWNEEVAVDPM